jgi:hypothetical protein
MEKHDRIRKHLGYIPQTNQQMEPKQTRNQANRTTNNSNGSTKISIPGPRLNSSSNKHDQMRKHLGYIPQTNQQMEPRRTRNEANPTTNNSNGSPKKNSVQGQEETMNENLQNASLSNMTASHMSKSMHPYNIDKKNEQLSKNELIQKLENNWITVKPRKKNLFNKY